MLRQYQHPSETELLEIFPEGGDMAKRNLRLAQKEYNEIEPILAKFLEDRLVDLHINRQGKPDSKYYGTDFYVKLANIIFYEYPLKPLKERIARLKRLVKIVEFKRAAELGDNSGYLDVARAKEYPLASIVEPNRSNFIKCPFHDEKTASCKIYPDNRFHCFGCGKDGDVIDMAMEVYNVEFAQAVKLLLER